MTLLAKVKPYAGSFGSVVDTTSSPAGVDLGSERERSGEPASTGRRQNGLAVMTDELIASGQP